RVVVQCPRLFQGAAHGGDRGVLLADGDVDALDLLLRVAALPVVALVDDRVDRNRGLAGLPVADDELTLPASDRGHGVDGLDAGLEGLLHRLALHNGWRLRLQQPLLGGVDVPLTVERPTERVDDATQELVTDGYGEDLAGAAYLLPLLDVGVVTEQHAADLADVEVQRETAQTTLELEQLVGH